MFSHRTNEAKCFGTCLKSALLCIAVTCALSSIGCSDARDQFGRTWYIDGVGNWGFGVREVKTALDQSGYRGHFENFRWSVTMNPLLDQTLRVFSKSGAERLASNINAHFAKYPDTEVNLIGLSAGTGVAVWAAERIKPPYKLNNVILLSSSLSSSYDLQPALRNISGKVVCYYSRTDNVLDGPCRITGTIDGQFDDAAGLVGFKRTNNRVVNIGWEPRFRRLGWTGGHTDSTSEPFIRSEVAQYILDRDVTGSRYSGDYEPRIQLAGDTQNGR